MEFYMLDLASGLLDAGAVRLNPSNPFTWASGMKAPIYCDNRQLLGFPELRSSIVETLAERASEKQPTLIAGTSTAGIPWAALVADRLKLPLSYVRPEPKKHGMGRQVEGPNTKDQRVVLLEDLISTGGSSLKCVEGLRAEGAEVLEILALFSYGLPLADMAFREAGVPLRVLTSFEELAQKAQDKGILQNDDRLSLMEWRKDTSVWSKVRGGA